MYFIALLSKTDGGRISSKSRKNYYNPSFESSDPWVGLSPDRYGITEYKRESNDLQDDKINSDDLDEEVNWKATEWETELWEFFQQLQDMENYNTNF